MKRRVFSLWLPSFIGTLTFVPVHLLGWCRRARAEIRRRVLAADTDIGLLAYEDPAELDPQNLPLTPVEKFGVSGTRDHRVPEGSWRLEIGGLVRHPSRLSLEKIQQLALLERKVLLICPGTFAYVARWQGFSLGQLLQSLKLDPTATHVDILGPPGEDRKVERFSLKEVLRDQVFLATGVNGIPLPLQHGYPLRVVAEGHVGAEWVKYVYGVEVVFSDIPDVESAPSSGTGFLP